MGSSHPKPQLKEGVVSCGGKAVDYIPGFCRRMVLNAIEECERIKGSPGSHPEIFVVLRRTQTRFISQAYCGVFMQLMFREDLIYSDNFTTWSLTNKGEGKENFELMSEKMARIYKGYRLNA